MQVDRSAIGPCGRDRASSRPSHASMQRISSDTDTVCEVRITASVCLRCMCTFRYRVAYTHAYFQSLEYPRARTNQRAHSLPSNSVASRVAFSLCCWSGFVHNDTRMYAKSHRQTSQGALHISVIAATVCRYGHSNVEAALSCVCSPDVL
eukprot:6186942-Pleurochrysis_carterae.AAC.2